MAYREVRVFDVKEVLRLGLAGVPIKTIAGRLAMDAKTVRRYVQSGRRHGVALPMAADGITDEVVAAVIAEVATMPGRPRGATREQCVAHREVIAQLLERGVRLSKVRKLLDREHGVAVPYMTLWRFAVEELGFNRPRSTVAVLEGEPGQELQVDTGWLPLVVPDARGRRRRVRVWIFTPSRSRYRFVYPCFEESTATAIEACEAAWDFYGGVFHVLIPDNTKAIVELADEVAPKLNEGFLEYAQARGFQIDPTRKASPTHKAKVERSVRIVRDDCFGGETIETIERARDHARWWCADDYGVRRHSRTCRRPREHFETEERAALLPAPTSRYDIPIWASPKVARDHYAQVARALYSLPTALIGKTLRARADSVTVRFYDRGALVKTHPRQAPGGRSTDPNDFPEHEGAIAHRDLAFVRRMADKHGEHVARMSDAILAGPLPWARVRRVYMLVGLAKKYGSARLDEACARALAVEMHDVRRLERMLAAAVPAPVASPSAKVIPIARYLRPPTDYALRRSQRDGEEGETT